MHRLKLIAMTAAALAAAWLPAITRAETASAAPAEEKGGIQWFTRLKDGLAEAKRTGKPILFLSAAPSCGGVPGVW